ncbi:uncharacterized protein LOC112906827 [Agrilus planipennis]|uniref:Uncharacterized protein LOC108744939 n=1 Tax=Agrilus planipennis TaxID=224129 RepID=A0A1W4XVG0_AGRPL|nr:uncharacterized protein LOC108744939 [Agrilus planipennis]XP_025837611.1 uncharacterized protein LOC112906827 [Agrilus planipennis]
MDTSLKEIVSNHPIEAVILWSKLHHEGKTFLTECTENFTRLQIVKLYYTAVALGGYNVLKLHQKDIGDVTIETSEGFSDFSQYLKLDGDYHCKNYMPSLLELSRLAARKFIISVKNVPDTSTFNNISKNLKIPNNLVDYISFK